jgi:hypothetical protein
MQAFGRVWMITGAGRGFGANQSRASCSSGGEDPHTGLAQPSDHGFPDPLGATGDERPTAAQFEILAHEPISSDAILLPSSRKTN